jgi:hypothetical protein
VNKWALLHPSASHVHPVYWHHNPLSSHTSWLPTVSSNLAKILFSCFFWGGGEEVSLYHYGGSYVA